MATRPRQRRKKGLSIMTMVVGGLMAFLMIGAVGYGGAIAAGIVEPPDFAAMFGKQPVEEASAPREIIQPPGTVATFFCPREVPAFTRITRDMILADDGQPIIKFYDPKEVPEHWITNGNDLIGRVLASDKLPGRVFTERDFFPDGTTEGIAAGIPPGMRAFVVSPKQIRGLSELKRYNRFDVFKSKEYSEIVVSNGIIIQPARRMLTAEERARVDKLMKNNRSNSFDKDLMDITIAVAPEHVDRLSRALASSSSTATAATNLYAVVHSGRPDAEADVQYSMAVPVATTQPVAVRETAIEEMRGMSRRPVRFKETHLAGVYQIESGHAATRARSTPMDAVSWMREYDIRRTAERNGATLSAPMPPVKPEDREHVMRLMIEKELRIIDEMQRAGVKIDDVEGLLEQSRKSVREAIGGQQ